MHLYSLLLCLAFAAEPDPRTKFLSDLRAQADDKLVILSNQLPSEIDSENDYHDAVEEFKRLVDKGFKVESFDMTMKAIEYFNHREIPYFEVALHLVVQDFPREIAPLGFKAIQSIVAAQLKLPKDLRCYFLRFLFTHRPDCAREVSWDEELGFGCFPLPSFPSRAFWTETEFKGIARYLAQGIIFEVSSGVTPSEYRHRCLPDRNGLFLLGPTSSTFLLLSNFTQLHPESLAIGPQELVEMIKMITQLESQDSPISIWLGFVHYLLPHATPEAKSIWSLMVEKAGQQLEEAEVKRVYTLIKAAETLDFKPLDEWKDEDFFGTLNISGLKYLLRDRMDDKASQAIALLANRHLQDFVSWLPWDGFYLLSAARAQQSIVVYESLEKINWDRFLTIHVCRLSLPFLVKAFGWDKVVESIGAGSEGKPHLLPIFLISMGKMASLDKALEGVKGDLRAEKEVIMAWKGLVLTPAVASTCKSLHGACKDGQFDFPDQANRLAIHLALRLQEYHQAQEKTSQVKVEEVL